MPQIELLLRRKIAEANKAYALFAPNDRVLVALSGGADSVALLLSLRKFYPSLSLTACHVNHHLRGKEAERDAAFAEELCKKNGIPFELCSADVAALAAKQKISTELAARNVRYAFFKDICRKRSIPLVACAHTSSDNAETVLFNLTRGAGLSGLSGIPPKRVLDESVTLIRPLIFAERAQIEAFLAAIGQSYVTDSTNLTDDYTRNFFRHQVLPLLKTVNPSLESGLSSTSRSLRDAQIFIEKTANNSLTDKISELAKLDEPILRQCILLLYRKCASDTPESVHISAIAALVRETAQTGKNAEICLPGGFSALLSDGYLRFSPTVRKIKTEDKPYFYAVSDGFFRIPDTPFAIEYTGASALLQKEHTALPDGFTLYDSAMLDSHAYTGLFVRSRRAGDTVKCGGMTRKLKELFNKKKIPAELRAVLPIVCGEGGEPVYYVPRTALSDVHARVLSNPAERLCRIRIYIQNGV